MNKHPLIDTIIFDFGGVLMDWDPRYLYRKIFDSEEKIEWFLAYVCTSEWNHQQDAGRDLEEAIKLKQEEFPGYKAEIAAFYHRWIEMLGGPIEENVAILRSLAHGPYSLYGLTNWSHQTFPLVYEDYDFFNIFKGIIVSGAEKMAKPDREIFDLVVERYQLTAEKSLFIDDSQANIETAQALGFKTIHLTSHKSLAQELEDILS
ncbi:MAG: HAD family phosphatase [Bacteroidota bacterium]